MLSQVCSLCLCPRSPSVAAACALQCSQLDTHAGIGVMSSDGGSSSTRCPLPRLTLRTIACFDGRRRVACMHGAWRMHGLLFVGV